MLFEDTYWTIKAKSQGIYKDKGSKFISYAFPVKTEEEIKQEIANLRKEHASARHHCFAFRLGADKQFYRSNDDGEPSGTAGKPIFNQIQSQDLTNILIVVVRYFGGILLGVSGLINAYKNAAADALNNASIIEKTSNEEYEVLFEHTEMNEVMKIIKEEKTEVLSKNFNNTCKLMFSVRKNNADRIVSRLKNISNLEVEFIKNS